ncbi:uncharacterized protein [Choristoneura fumiferana]|uniref:uncharacterized protein n=1 Tax=Choristoneura fumiferana TaxID=7141 RepID=UPI003D15F1FE
MAKSNFNTVNTLTNTLVNNMDCNVAWSSKLRSSTIHYPIHVKTVEQINQEYDNSISKVSIVYDSVPPVYEENTDSRESTPSPGRLYTDESRENLTTSSPLTLPNNDDCHVAWSSKLRSSTIHYPSLIRVKTVEQINQEYDNSISKVSNVYDSVPLVYEEYTDSRDSTPSPGRLYTDESKENLTTSCLLTLPNNDECSVTWSLTTRMSVIAPLYPINYFDDECAGSRDSTPSPGRLFIDESVDYENLTITLNTFSKINEYSEAWSSTTRMPIIAPLSPINDLNDEDADSRDSTPISDRLDIDESMSSPNTADVEMNESSDTWSSTARMPITAPLRPINDFSNEYADSRDSTPSPGRLYIDESMSSPNTADVEMNECSETWSSVTTHLCPIKEPALLMDVKTVKKEYEKFFPYHPKPKLRRQRLNAYRDA